MSSLAQDIGLAGGVTGALYRSQLVPTSTSYTVTQPGWAIVTGMGAGAGGTKSSSYPPGNSAPWGVKGFPVAVGDVIAITIGAGGAPNASGAALAGGATTVTLNGAVIMTCQPGDAGVLNAKAPVAARVIGADFWVPGRQPQSAIGNTTGGAAVDCGASTFAGNSAGDYAVQLNSGTVGMPAGSHMWAFDITFYSGNAGGALPGYPSGGGGPAGLFAGGNGAQDASATYAAGRGASAGVSSYASTTAKAGGDGLAHLRLYANVG